MSLPFIQSKSDLAGHEGNPVKICGYYGVQDMGGYTIKVKTADGNWKRIRRIAYIKLQDGCFINLENRPDNEMKTLDGRRVIATGNLISPADPPAKPIMASPDAVPTLIKQPYSASE